MQPTIVFDLGEVLVQSTGVLPALAAELGVPEADLDAAYWPQRAAYDLGGSARAYWTSVVTGVDREPHPDLLDRLTAVDSGKWATLPAAASELLARLDGRRMGVLSNAPAPLATAVREAPWSRAFAHLVFSAEVALLKPDPAIYARTDELLGTVPSDVVFFDDRPENVDAARAHGWSAHVWVDPATALRVLG